MNDAEKQQEISLREIHNTFSHNSQVSCRVILKYFFVVQKWSASAKTLKIFSIFLVCSLDALNSLQLDLYSMKKKLTFG